MASTPETKVKSAVRAYLSKERVYHFTPMSYGMARSGIPDIIACVNGYFLGIECKAGKGKPTALQIAEMASIERAGGMTLVIRENNFDDLRVAIATLKARRSTIKEKLGCDTE